MRTQARENSDARATCSGVSSSSGRTGTTSPPGTQSHGTSTAATATSSRTARVQVLLDATHALLLCYRQRRWYLEGVYE